MRYFLELAYSGTQYHGWQRQPDAITVQEVVEEKLSVLLGKTISITGAGRTDTGVHAKQLFAHLDMDKIEDITGLMFRLNSFLPKDISIQKIAEVGNDAHARFDAIAREYEYHISINKNVFKQEFAFELYQLPNVEKMNKAATILWGHQDFQCFSRSNTDVKTYYCDIKKAVWELRGDNLIFTIAANRFLRNMVRAIVGTLLDIGFEKKEVDDLHRIIASKDRSLAGASAPAKGLFLTKVSYPDAFNL